MSANAREWLVILSFFLLAFIVTVLEIMWLKRKGWADVGKSVIFTIFTNLIGYSVGFIVLFVVFGVTLALAWDGSIKKFPLGDYGIGTFLILGVLFTPMLLMLCKRLFLLILKMQSGISAWLFSFVSSVLSFIISLGVPIVVAYLLFR